MKQKLELHKRNSMRKTPSLLIQSQDEFDSEYAKVKRNREQSTFAQPREVYNNMTNFNDRLT